MGLKAGVSRICITPPLGIPIGGTFIRPNAVSVHDDLWAKCLFLENGESRIALLCCDLLGLSFETVDQVLDMVRKRVDLRQDQLVLSCTHNHSGPDTASIIHEPLSPNYMDSLAEKLAQAVVEAASNLQPATAGYAVGELTGVCLNRRIRVKDGKVRMNWEAIPEDEITGYGPIDPTLGVLRVDSADGKPLAAVVYYTCHAAVVSPAPMQISSDYPGYTCRMIERLYRDGITAMFVNGAFGNINHIMKPASFNAMAFGTAAERPFEEAERVGQHVAAKALELLPVIKTSDVEIGSAFKSITVALRKPPVVSLEEAEAEVKRRRERLEDAGRRGDADQDAGAQIDLTYAEHWANYFRKGITEAEIRLGAVSIGDLGLATISGEPFVEIGFAIKEQSSFPTTWILGNTNGYSGYLPTEEAFEQGGYEVRTCGWSKWRVEADKIVISESVKLLNGLKKAK